VTVLHALAATLSRAGRLARAAASGPDWWRGAALYAAVLALNFVGVWVSIRLIAWNKAFFDALGALDGQTALRQVGVFFLLVSASAGSWLAADWLRKRLLILWRGQLTAQALDLWLGGWAYWQLRPGFGAVPVENPDQRVAEDCRKFVEGLLEFTLDLISGAVALVSFVALLWSLSTFALPACFAGQVTLGGLMQLASAFSQVTTALSWFIFFNRDPAGFVAVCERLDGLMAAARAPAPLPGAPQAILRTASPDGALHLQGLRLATPDGRWLPALPDCTIRPGARVWNSGASGEGKTTLLAAIGGIWLSGEGRIAVPEARFLTLPAGAPVFAEGLAAAACYPEDPATQGSAKLNAVLTRLGLGHRLDTADEAALSGLSMGERQRLGLARAALLRPDWLVMDEATSALDPAFEADLMTWLSAELPGTTFLIVSHRAPAGLTLDDVLRIGPDAAPERKTA